MAKFKNEKMTKDAETYFIDGCGRCPLGGTPACKVHKWEKELKALREIVLDSGLTEESKWGVPCYTWENGNVAIVSAFVDYCALSFFKGSLLKDEGKLLHKPGENSQSARLFKFTEFKQIMKLEDTLKNYVFEAIEVEKAGLKVELKDNSSLDFPDELLSKFEEDPVLKSAFVALTPGRQRGYNIFFTSAKQAKTREARIEKCIPLIMEGRGLHDRY